MNTKAMLKQFMSYSQIGYGAIMDAASELWAEYLKEKGMPPGGQFVVGPCSAEVVPCNHEIKNENGHCELCAGSGWITKGVQSLLEERNTLQISLNMSEAHHRERDTYGYL